MVRDDRLLQDRVARHCCSPGSRQLPDADSNAYRKLHAYCYRDCNCNAYRDRCCYRYRDFDAYSNFNPEAQPNTENAPDAQNSPDAAAATVNVDW